MQKREHDLVGKLKISKLDLKQKSGPLLKWVVFLGCLDIMSLIHVFSMDVLCREKYQGHVPISGIHQWMSWFGGPSGVGNGARILLYFPALGERKNHPGIKEWLMVIR